MFKFINSFLVLVLLFSVNSAFSMCRKEQTYGVGEQAVGNCYILKGEPGKCTVMNWQTRYQVCQCYIGCDTEEPGNGNDGSYRCRIETVYGVREQAYGNCAALGGDVKSCTVMNWNTGYQVCKCQICR
jgi:hypothetical protein